MKIRSYNKEGNRQWKYGSDTISRAIKGYINFDPITGYFNINSHGWNWLYNKKNTRDGNSFKHIDGKIVVEHSLDKSRVFKKDGKFCKVPCFEQDFTNPIKVRDLWKMLNKAQVKPGDVYESTPQEGALQELVEMGAVSINCGDIQLVPEYSATNLNKAINSVSERRKKFADKLCNGEFEWQLNEICFSSNGDGKDWAGIVPIGQVARVEFQIIDNDNENICNVTFTHDKCGVDNDGGIRVDANSVPSDLQFVLYDVESWLTKIIKTKIQVVGAMLHKKLPPDITLLFTEALLGGFACLRPLCETPKSLPSADLVALNAPAFKMAGDR